MTDGEELDSRNVTFSQAQGYEALPGPLALGEISKEARTKLWDLLAHTAWEPPLEPGSLLVRWRRLTLVDIGEGRGGIDGATDVGICHGAGDEEHRPVSGRGKRQATGDRHTVCAALGARRTIAAAADRDN